MATRQEEFIDLIAPACQAAAREWPGVWASVAIGQAILETGWGDSLLSSRHHNYFGVKWSGNPTGPFPGHATGAVQLETTERPDSGTFVTRAWFRTYADPLGSALDYAANLHETPAYARAGAFEATSAAEFIRRIGPVYTGGDSSYPTLVLTLMDRYGLRRFDEEIMTTKTLRGFRMAEEAYWLLLALEELAVHKGWCKKTLDIYQGTGFSTKSGGTHAPPGGAVDFWQGANPRDLLRAARNGGFPGWHRTPAQGFGNHVHAGVKGLKGRPYNYQLDALLAGYNGLGKGGRGGRDDGPRDVKWRNYTDGLAWLRAQIPKDEPVKAAVVQTLPDYWNPWLAVDAWDNANPDDATLTGLSDVQLRERFIEHGFVFYSQGSLHEDMRFTLADFAGSLALEDIPRKPDEVAWDLLQRITAAPDPGIVWVELRPAFTAAHSGGGFDAFGETRTRHSVRAVQSGVNHVLGASIPEDGLFGPQTRAAVSDFQVRARGARAGSSAADGVPGVHDFLRLTAACSQRTGTEHRARHLY